MTPSPHSPLIASFARRAVALLDVTPGVQTPLVFSDAATEHLSTRRAAGLFDFSFMACFDIAGPDVVPYLQHVQTRDLRTLAIGRIAYTLLCRADGTVLNDATVWRRDAAAYRIFTGRRADHNHLAAPAAHWNIDFRDVSGEHAIIALQGPRSLDVLRALTPGLPAIGYFEFAVTAVGGTRCEVGRIGYAGERGYELVTGAANAEHVWHSLTSAGAKFGMLECGFDAIDSLRIEAGHILFAHELLTPVTPAELGLDRLARFDRAYLGGSAHSRARWRPPMRRLVGLIPTMETMDGPITPRHEADLRPGRASLTSVRYAPTFNRMLGMGFVPHADRYPGTLARLSDGRSARVARLPFYDPAKRLPRGD